MKYKITEVLEDGTEKDVTAETLWGVFHNDLAEAEPDAEGHEIPLSVERWNLFRLAYGDAVRGDAYDSINYHFGLWLENNPL